MNFLVLLSFLLLFYSILTQSNTEWTDPVSGTYFNFVGLKRVPTIPWSVRKETGVFAELYRFNFGDNVSFMCHGKLGAATEHMEVFQKPTSTCSILGDINSRTVELINPFKPSEGIIVEYGGGDMCARSYHSLEKSFKSAKFYLYCAEKQDENVIY
jgi:hypothetical protein